LNNPFSPYCDTRQNEGKVKQLRLALAADVLTNVMLDTDIEDIGPASFQFFERWIATFTNEDTTINSFKISDGADENGRKNDAGFSIMVPEDILPSNFHRWWRSVKRRHLVAEVENFNGVVRVLNPLEISYEYVLPTEFAKVAYYEFFLKPTRMVGYDSDKVQINAIVSVAPACETLILNANALCLT
jgi:hypothetical protein